MISNRYPALLMTALSLCSGTAIGSSYSLTDLGSFGAGGSYGFDINNSGQVVGFSYTTAQSGYVEQVGIELCLLN